VAAGGHDAFREEAEGTEVTVEAFLRGLRALCVLRG
jgi:hypothetical protein